MGIIQQMHHKRNILYCSMFLHIVSEKNTLKAIKQ